MNCVFSCSFYDKALPCFPFSDQVFPYRLHYAFYTILKRKCTSKSCSGPAALPTLHMTLGNLDYYHGSGPMPYWRALIPQVQYPIQTPVLCSQLPTGALHSMCQRHFQLHVSHTDLSILPTFSSFTIHVLKSQHRHSSSLPYQEAGRFSQAGAANSNAYGGTQVANLFIFI